MCGRRKREEEEDNVDVFVGVEGGKRGGRRGWKYEVSILLLRISTWLRDGGCAQGEKVEGAEVTAHGGGTLGVQMGWYNGH